MTAAAQPRGARTRTRTRTPAILIAALLAFAAASAIAAPDEALNQEVASGVVALGINGSPDDAASAGVSGMLPGDAAQRAMTIDNRGSADWSQLLLSAYVEAGADSSLLDTDPVLGLQLRADRCSVPWASEGAALTCPGVLTRDVVVPGPVARSNVAVTASPASVAGAHDHLRITTWLPENAGNEFLGLRSALTLRFTAVQRDASAL